MKISNISSASLQKNVSKTTGKTIRRVIFKCRHYIKFYFEIKDLKGESVSGKCVPFLVSRKIIFNHGQERIKGWL